MSKVIVIGGGPAGMFAAYFAAKNGHKVTLLEQNEKLGKKLYITGKGRCNITNASDMENLFANVCSNEKFLYSAFYSYTNEQVVDFFESYGLRTKVERGNRVFPLSDHSSDVIATLSKALKDVGVEVKLYTKVAKLLSDEYHDENGETVVADKKNGVLKQVIRGVLLEDGTSMQADSVVLATGGISYPSTGATGDGYRFAEGLNHKIVEPSPSLVPFEVQESWVTEMQGLALKNVAITIEREGKKLYDDFGEMLFTHFGVSGPMILSASASIKPAYFKDFAHELKLKIDLKPALDREQLDKRILKDFEESKNKQYKNSIQKLLPSKMIPIIIRLSGIDPDKKVNEITKEERMKLVELLKALPMTIIGLRGWNEAIITKGGVSVKQVNPSTMESKLVNGLYFAGELLDLDAMTGGYNLQIAWSTGYLAGSSIQ
ncbi:MAG: NAD(P)/FAD-dependent oxidoreductase [Agathobacter sp.]|nr:NAD(P)/FAD-dependent oxidoreductase [Agathobacter sp.]